MLKPLFSLASPAGARAKLSILIFHRVRPERDPLVPGEVTRDEFDRICTWVKQWFVVLPLSEAAQRRRDGRLPARALSITFDDGYADNHDVALPVLRQHGLSATFFIATGFLDGGRMWNDSVIEAIRAAPGDGIDLAGTAAASLGRLACGTLDERRASLTRAIDASKYLPQPVRDEWVDAIVQRCGAPLPRDLMMTSQQVRALHRAGMEIGGHTVTHPILARLEPAQMADEIGSGRDRLQEIVGQRIGLFAYPNGRPGVDYRPDAVQLVRDMGFDAAVSTAWGVSRRDADPFQLARFTPWDRTRTRFGLRMLRNLATAPA
jgi:peptidoglycan/xylan/chitin deacetylase (PgdA/CDA1 family)